MIFDKDHSRIFFWSVIIVIEQRHKRPHTIPWSRSFQKNEVKYQSYFFAHIFMTRVEKPYLNGVSLSRQLQYQKSFQSNCFNIFFQGVLDLSREILWVCVSQRATKLWSMKIWGCSNHPAIEPRPPTHSAQWAEKQGFFKTSNFDSLQLCSPVTYRGPQYLFWKILNS